MSALLLSIRSQTEVITQSGLIIPPKVITKDNIDMVYTGPRERADIVILSSDANYGSKFWY